MPESSNSPACYYRQQSLHSGQWGEKAEQLLTVGTGPWSAAPAPSLTLSAAPQPQG